MTVISGDTRERERERDRDRDRDRDRETDRQTDRVRERQRQRQRETVKRHLTFIAQPAAKLRIRQNPFSLPTQITSKTHNPLN